MDDAVFRLMLAALLQPAAVTEKIAGAMAMLLEMWLFFLNFRVA